MCHKIPLTRRAVRIIGSFLFCAFFLLTACKKESVTSATEVAQNNPNASAPTTAPVAAQPATATATTTASPMPSLVPAQPGATPAALPTAGTTPAAGATPDPAPNMRHLNGGKMITVTGKQGADDFVIPPPPPTPTPAPTPVIEMVNGKIKQEWEAPAEYTNMKSPLTVTPELLKRGKYLYMNRCESCHGAEGKGNGFYNKPEFKQATNLVSKVVQANTDGELFYKVSFNRGRHPSSRLIYTEEERWMVVAFLRTLK